jgi:hypothetical protein
MLVELLPYDEFSALRLGQFLPDGAATGWYSCDRQVWRCARHQTFGTSTAFCFADEAGSTLSGIVANMKAGELPLDAADAILRAIGLPLDTSATADEVLAKLGKPNYASGAPNYEGLLFFRFVVGARWPYLLGLHVRPSGGLARFLIGRSDMLVPDPDEEQ